MLTETKNYNKILISNNNIIANKNPMLSFYLELLKLKQKLA
jgi:hypothetical protein